MKTHGARQKSILTDNDPTKPRENTVIAVPTPKSTNYSNIENINTTYHLTHRHTHRDKRLTKIIPNEMWLYASKWNTQPDTSKINIHTPPKSQHLHNLLSWKQEYIRSKRSPIMQYGCRRYKIEKTQQQKI